MPQYHELRVRHLDEQLASFRAGLELPPPPKGWIHEIRVALGMTLKQFAGRLGAKAPQNAKSMEMSEADGRINLNSLRAAARALDCELVYALVPRPSLSESIHTRAQMIARERIGRVSRTMALESQGVGQNYDEAELKRLTEETAANPPRDFWDLPTLP